MNEEKTICPEELIERAFRRTGKSEYDDSPLHYVIKIILEAIASELED